MGQATSKKSVKNAIASSPPSSLEEKRAEITEQAVYSFAKHFPGHFWTFQMDGRAQLCPSAVPVGTCAPQLYLKCWATKEINNGGVECARAEPALRGGFVFAAAVAVGVANCQCTKCTK